MFVTVAAFKGTDNPIYRTFPSHLPFIASYEHVLDVACANSP